MDWKKSRKNTVSRYVFPFFPIFHISGLWKNKKNTFPCRKILIFCRQCCTIFMRIPAKSVSTCTKVAWAHICAGYAQGHVVDIEGFITLGPVARGHHREGTASPAWLLPHEHPGDPPRWSCWRRSTDETCWNCGPVRSGKICATQIHKHTDTPRPPLGTTTTTTEGACDYHF